MAMGSGFHNLNYRVKRGLVSPSKREIPHSLIVLAFLRIRFDPRYCASYESHESLTPMLFFVSSHVLRVLILR